MEIELRQLEKRFKFLLFGVCSGLMESFYLMVVSKSPIDKAAFAGVFAQMEKDCSASDVQNDFEKG